MAEHPILFNSEMVRALLNGKKTQTRRIIKGLPLYAPYFEVDEGRGWLEDSEDGNFYAIERFSRVQPGDVLWVRETWQRLFDHKGWRYEYKADRNDAEPLRLGGVLIPWRPSIHMPREAARLFLTVKEVRAERLQSITPQEIMAEGLDVLGKTTQTAYRMWKELWNDTVKKDELDKYGWDANPWVWVIEFRRDGGRPAISGG